MEITYTRPSILLIRWWRPMLMFRYFFIFEIVNKFPVLDAQHSVELLHKWSKFRTGKRQWKVQHPTFIISVNQIIFSNAPFHSLVNGLSKSLGTTTKWIIEREKCRSVKNGSEKRVDEFPCNVCGKVFKWIESLRHHELKHLREYTLFSAFLSVIFIWIYRTRYECIIFQPTMTLERKLLGNLNAAHAEKFWPALEPFRIIRNFILVSLIKWAHQNSECALVCCNMRILDKEEDRKPYPCVECPKRFHTAAHLERHKRTHWR